MKAISSMGIKTPIPVLAGALILASLVLGGHLLNKDRCVQGELTVTPPHCELRIPEYDICISGVDSKGVTYFCLPTYCYLDKIEQESGDSVLILNKDGTKLSEAKLGVVQAVDVLMEDGTTMPWQISFLKSENLDSVFIDLSGYELKEVDHDLLSDAYVRVFDTKGVPTLIDNIQIKGHGNGTWEEDKKSYEFRLKDKASICGLSPSKRWTLLANQESTAMTYKLGMDLAALLGMEYAIESEYVDMYVNGRYMGNYVLCKEPHIGEGDLNINNLQDQNKAYLNPSIPFQTDKLKGFVNTGNPSNITGGYLIEKIFAPDGLEDPAGFYTDHNSFSLKSPRNASKEQVEYISSYMEKVDKSIYEQGDSQLGMIDQYSFVRWFLVEEFMLNADSEVASKFFYKKTADDNLYAGPVWDVEPACGESSHYDGYFLNYNNSIMDCDEYLPYYKEPIMWDKLLFQNPDYKRYMANVFSENLAVFESVVFSHIDECYEKIKPSIIMDRAIWGYSDGGNGHYSSYDNIIRYTKFWMYNRLLYMMRLLDIDAEVPVLDYATNEEHNVTFIFPDGTKEFHKVKDGQQIKDELCPQLDKTEFTGWKNETTEEPLSYYLPILEDTVYIPNKTD